MSTARTHFVNLRVYKLAEKLADEVCHVVVSWEHFPRETVGTQIVRAADSIEANIAEGMGRRSFVENRRFVRMARGSLNKTRDWLRRAHHRGLLKEGIGKQNKAIADELSLKPNAYLRSIGDLVQKDRAEARPQGTKTTGGLRRRSTNNVLRTADQGTKLLEDKQLDG